MKIYSFETSTDNKPYKFYANELSAINHLNEIRSRVTRDDLIVVDTKHSFGIRINDKYGTTVIWTIKEINVEE